MTTREVGAYEAKTHLPALLDAVERGEVVYITRRGKRIAELRRAAQGPRPSFGSARGEPFVLDAAFDEPLQELAEYER